MASSRHEVRAYSTPEPAARYEVGQVARGTGSGSIVRPSTSASNSGNWASLSWRRRSSPSACFCAAGGASPITTAASGKGDGGSDACSSSASPTA
jgi:hypothetical protein